MCGAIPVYMLAWVWRRGRPSLCGTPIPAKSNHALDSRLIVGASLFGIGWAWSGSARDRRWRISRRCRRR